MEAKATTAANGVEGLLPMDATTVETLYVQYGGAVYRRCLYMLRNPDEAESAMQDIFVRLLKAMDKGHKVKSMRGYLFAIATNHCLNRLRSRRRTPPMVQLDRQADWRPGPEREVAAASLIDECFGELEGKKLLVMYLYFGEGMTQEEVAEVTGVSRRSVGKWLRAFQALMSRKEQERRAAS